MAALTACLTSWYFRFSSASMTSTTPDGCVTGLDGFIQSDGNAGRQACEPHRAATRPGIESGVPQQQLHDFCAPCSSCCDQHDPGVVRCCHLVVLHQASNHIHVRKAGSDAAVTAPGVSLLNRSKLLFKVKFCYE